MRISQAGIRSGLPTTRFAAASGNRRESHLGLRRRLAPQVATPPSSTARTPLLAALRHAARGIGTTPRHESGTTQATNRNVLRRSDSMNWAQLTSSVPHRARPRSAAPWRG